MTDLISRQAAVRWVKIECNPYGNPTIDFESGKRIIEHLEQMPSVDAVPVVRCRECKHNYSKKLNKRYDHEWIVCDYWETDGLNDDDFCSHGERSEE